MMKSIVMIGTDTDCGKTYATCQLLQFLNQQNLVVQGFKPLASGCEHQQGLLYSLDEEALRASGPYPDISGWRFAPPISPHIAAQAEGIHISMDALLQKIIDAENPSVDYQLVEGAGGLMAPINQAETWLDFLVMTQLPVILVVGMKLGCLNHALLTDSALKTNNIPVLGWIANRIDPMMLAFTENLATLQGKLQSPMLGVIPYQGEFEQSSCVINQMAQAKDLVKIDVHQVRWVND